MSTSIDHCNAVAHARQVAATILDPSDDLQTRLETVFDAETAALELPYAFLTHVGQSNDTLHIQIAHGSHDDLKPGTAAPLSDTYCRKTIADSDGAMWISDAVDEGFAGDPAYECLKLGSYIGATVEVDGEVYGTICFASSTPRDDPITEHEVELVKLLAQLVGYEIEKWGATIETTRKNGEFQTVLLSPETDRALEVLAAPQRRVILFYLLDETIENETDIRPVSDESTGIRTELRHVHLPKLADEGYIEWEMDTGDISKGSRFTEIEPFLQLLVEYISAADFANT